MFMDKLSLQKFRFKSFMPLLMVPTLAGLSYQPLLAATPITREYYIQVGAYQRLMVAKSSLRRVEAESKGQFRGRIRKETQHGKLFYQVQMGPFPTLQAANQAHQKLTKIVYPGFIRSYNGKFMPEPAPAVINRHEPILPTNQSVTTSVLVPIPPRPVLVAPPLALFGSFPYNPRVLGEGTLAEKTNFFGGDGLFPLIGNNDWIGYFDGLIKYGDDDAWLGSFGAGFRSITAGNCLFGAYLFGDRNVSTHKQIFWFVNPGLEWMSNLWDARINAYIPVSSKNQSLGIFQGNQLGMNTNFFRGHALFEKLFNVMDVTGPGVDGEVGYTFPAFNYIRPFIGGYHFDISNGPQFTGVEGGIEIPFNPMVTVLLRDAYDKVQGNTALATLRISFGAIDKGPIPDIHDRMLDPIQRHLGAFQTGAGVPFQKVNLFAGEQVLQNNIWFFRPGGPEFMTQLGFDNCTFENPCGVFSQAAISGIGTLSQNALFYFAPGVYNNPLVGTGYTLDVGQTLWGRTNDFMFPATGNQRALINDTIFLTGNNSINDLQINGNTIFNTALTGVQVNAGATGTFSINNSSITAAVNGLPAISVIAVNNLSPNATLNLYNDTISAFSQNNTTGNTIGINNVGTVNLLNSTVTASAFNSSGDVSSILNFGLINIFDTSIITNTNTIPANEARAVFNVGGTANISNSTIQVNAANGAIGVNGVLSINNALTNIYGTTINVNVDSVTQGVGVFNASGTININDSNINVVGNNSETIGITNGGTMNVLNSVINATTDNGSFAFGVFLGNNSNFSMTNGSINATAMNSIGAVGISNDGSTFTLTNVALSTTSNTSQTGINQFNAATGNLINSTVTANALSGSSSVTGINASGTGSINLDGSTVTVNSEGTSGNVIGILNSVTLNMLNSVINVNANNGGSFVAGINNSGGIVNANDSNITINSNNSGAGVGNFGINNFAGGQVNLNGVNVNVVGTNLAAAVPVVGIANSGGATTTYSNSNILANANSPGVANATTGPGYTNLGNVICTTIQDGVATVAPCP